ncbi:MAG: hypothetical protein ACKV2Q_02930 [Planctomycetaceae bacterium]
MQRTPLSELLASVAGRVLQMAESDAELRSQLVSLARAVVAWSEAAGAAIESPVSGEAASLDQSAPQLLPPQSVVTPLADSVPGSVTKSDRVSSEPVKSAPLPRLTLGQPQEVLPSSKISYPPEWLVADETDLKLVASRCHLKAEASKWAAERRRLLDIGADFSVQIEPNDREIIARAKALPDCYLWMNNSKGPCPTAPRQFEELARGFEAVAEVIDVLNQSFSPPNDHGKEFEQLVDLLASTQSALRVSVETLDWKCDHDQQAVFNWLRRTASEKQILIQRHMRIDDVANPSEVPQFLERLHAIDISLQATAKKQKDRQRLLGKLRHKASIVRGAEGDLSVEWRILINTVDELVDGGLPPSSRELREILQSIIDDMPNLGELPKNFDLVQREMDRYLAINSVPETVITKEQPPEVKRVAELLKGRQVVLIGGDKRQAAYQQLKDAFALDELIWVEVKPHQPLAALETPVGRPEVAVVILAIRWCSHSHHLVEATCDRFGKPFVRLPGGYGVNQVASKILSQCGERLARSAAQT